MWPDPASSAGEHRGVIKIKTKGFLAMEKHYWEAKEGSPARKAFEELVPEIGRLLLSSGNRVPNCDSIKMDIFMLGAERNPGASAPYIMFSSLDSCKGARKAALKLVKESGLLKESGLKAGHWAYPPHTPSPELAGGGPMATGDASASLQWGIGEAAHIFKYKSGSIDAYENHSTIGAVVLYGRARLYFTAAHMLLPRRDSSLLEPSLNARGAGSLGPVSEHGSVYDSGDETENFQVASSAGSSPPSLHEDTEMAELESSSDSSSLNSETELANTHVQHEGGQREQQTETPYVNLGQQVFFVSSEMDFALLDLSDIEVPPYNLPVLEEGTVADIETGYTKVEACLGSGRTMLGELSGRPSYIRFPYGNAFQEVYSVIFETDVQHGDSGALVRDRQTSRIYGHIVAVSIESRTAFIVPATQVLKKMTQALPTITPVYAGLNGSRSQIRFIHLLPGSFNEAIRCNLETITLSMDTTLPFEALSYVWGNDEPRKFILLNGQPWPVGRNLAHILRRLRYEDRARSLWVDEVCINQDDVDEKFHQVRLLAKVYKQSARCLIWLGNVDEGSEPSSGSWTFSFQHTSPRQLSRNIDPEVTISLQDARLAFELLENLGTAALDYSTKLSRNPDEPGFYISWKSQEALGKLMGLAWWKQLRTVLGALLAGWSVLLCGPMSMSLHTVGANALRLRRFLRQRTWRRRSDGLHFDVLIPFMQTAVRLYRFRTGTRSYSYRFMLTAFQDLNCKDPQDMWPALGIIHHMPLALDTDTNAKIVSRYIHTKQDLLPLVRTTEYGRGAPLPSWVPDWEAGVGSQLHFYNELSFIMSWELFNASSGRSLLVEMWPNSMLRLLGVIVDEVRTTYSVMEPRIDEPVIRVKTGPKRLEGNLKTLLAKGGNSEHVSNDFWRLLTCDIRPDEKDDLKWRRARSSDRVVCEREYRNGLLGHGVRGRRLFSAGQGDFGLGPANTMIGDVVAVLYGGRFPFILRRAPGRNTYTLVGYAYVQGIMDGEALSGAAETEEIFLI